MPRLELQFYSTHALGCARTCTGLVQLVPRFILHLSSSPSSSCCWAIELQVGDATAAAVFPATTAAAFTAAVVAAVTAVTAALCHRYATVTSHPYL